MKFPLVITYPCGVDSDLINVVDDADQPIFGAAGCLPDHSNKQREHWQELVRRANAYDALVESLRAMRQNVDVSTINNSHRSTAKWTQLIMDADAALNLVELSAVYTAVVDDGAAFRAQRCEQTGEQVRASLNPT